MTLRPRRSLLYLPASNLRALAKARTLPADGLILDLEDAVAPAAKTEARANLIAALTEGGYGERELIVRVNGLDTPWGEADIAALAKGRPDAVLFPKVSDPHDVAAAVAVLERYRLSDLPVWVMAETARGILAIDRIAGAHAGLGAIVVGTSDLAKETRVRHTPGREGLITALSRCVYAARAHGLVVLDGVHLDLTDEAGFYAACRQGRDLGFDGKTLIHPKQLAVANELFAPSAEEVARAEAVMAAWQQAEAAGAGVVVVAGRLVEALHVEEARQTLALQRAIAARGES